MSMFVFRVQLPNWSGQPKERPPDTPASPQYFWRADQHETGYLSMLFPSPFQDVHDPTKIYPTAEHYLLHHQALLFGDKATAAAILATGSPHHAKELAKYIENFDVEVWHANRERIAAEANYYKFTCPPIATDSPLLPPGCPWIPARESLKSKAADLKKALLETGEHKLILGHPTDKFWGIGQTARRAWLKRERWGLNKMGICLMELRERLRIEGGGPGAHREGGFESSVLSPVGLI
ncbi:hypothetical protein F5Y13DRAFT_104127 [Hypoxylon sp. FL1857]|nr:hypothetical protein F5Y13DRAFT_104127 [Hypoxylon sp. FL1857]